MEMTPLGYYDNFVVPNYEDFCNDEESIRKAFNAAVSMYHMADIYFKYCRKHHKGKVSDYNKMKDFHIFLSKKSTYFNDIQSVANAYKHLYLQTKKPYVTVESTGAIVSIEIEGGIAINGLGQAPRGDRWNLCVVYHRKDGKAIRIKDALDAIIKIWNDFIDADLS